METIGFIGLGNMGNHMAANLIKAGHQLTVHDLRREAATNLLEMGAQWADTPREAVPGNEVVFTSLPVPRDVEAVVLGENGILEGADSSTVYMDLSTNSPTVIRRIHEICAQKGVTVLDAPVSGGVYGAAAATLAVMVGGDKAVYDHMKPTLDAIGSHVVYCGPIGNGMVCKICNNLLSMGIGVLMTEALTLGVKAGVEMAEHDFVHVGRADAGVGEGDARHADDQALDAVALELAERGVGDPDDAGGHARFLWFPRQYRHD